MIDKLLGSLHWYYLFAIVSLRWYAMTRFGKSFGSVRHIYTSSLVDPVCSAPVFVFQPKFGDKC